MRTAPQIMIVTNAMGGGVGVTAEPALASGSGRHGRAGEDYSDYMVWATI